VDGGERIPGPERLLLKADFGVFDIYACRILGGGGDE